MKTTLFTTGSGSKWDTSKPIRTSMRISNPVLTGKYEDHNLGGRGDIESMVEVDHDFGCDMIWEQFVSQ